VSVCALIAPPARTEIVDAGRVELRFCTAFLLNIARPTLTNYGSRSAKTAIPDKDAAILRQRVGPPGRKFYYPQICTNFPKKDEQKRSLGYR
jgi:hypothetical protein